MPSPLDPLCKKPGLMGEFSTKRAPLRRSVEAWDCRPGGSPGVAAKGPFATGYSLPQRASGV